MKKYVFTPRGHREFLEYYNRTRSVLNKTTREKAESGAEQDGWHEEGFKVGIGDELMWSQRFGELQHILMSSEIYIPIKQNEKVLIGNGIVLENDEGKTCRYYLDGYLTEPTTERISIYSPLGAAVKFKRLDDEISIKIHEKTRKFVIIEIVVPDVAETWL